jgi:hypothetical protein
MVLLVAQTADLPFAKEGEAWAGDARCIYERSRSRAAVSTALAARCDRTLPFVQRAGLRAGLLADGG